MKMVLFVTNFEKIIYNKNGKKTKRKIQSK